MSVTVTTPAGLPLYDAVGTKFRASRTITLDSVYVSGGEPVPASKFGLRKIHLAEAPVITVSTGAAASVYGVRPLVQTDGSLLLKVMVAADGESDLVEAGAIDLSGLTIVLTVAGI